MNKHIELLSQFPNSYFGSFYFIAAEMHKNKCLSNADIARLYHGLSVAISSNSKSVSVPEIAYEPRIGCFKFLDYINPRYNHIYEYVYDTKFSLPKLHRGLLKNRKPTSSLVIPSLKNNVGFKEARFAFSDFVNSARIQNLPYFNNMWEESDYKEHNDACYDTLTKLLTKVNLIHDETPSDKKGSVILTRELNNLLFSQNMILRRSHELAFAPTAREEIIGDIVKHKRAMFGELKHDWKHYQQSKAAINYKKAQSKESER